MLAGGIRVCVVGRHGSLERLQGSCERIFMVRELRLPGGSQFVQSLFRETHGCSSGMLLISPVAAQVPVGLSRVVHVRPENGSSTLDLERLVGMTCPAIEQTLKALTG